MADLDFSKLTPAQQHAVRQAYLRDGNNGMQGWIPKNRRTLDALRRMGWYYKIGYRLLPEGMIAYERASTEAAHAPAAPALSPNNPARHIPTDRDRAYSAYREATAKAGGKVLSFVGWLRLSEVAQPASATLETPADALDAKVQAAWKEAGFEDEGWTLELAAAPAAPTERPAFTCIGCGEEFPTQPELDAHMNRVITGMSPNLRAAYEATEPQPGAAEQAVDEYGDGYEAGMTDYARLYAQLLEARAEVQGIKDYHELVSAELRAERDALRAALATIRRYTGDHDMTDLTTEQVLGMAVGTLKIRDIADKALTPADKEQQS